MFPLDVRTVLSVLAINCVMAALALPAIMGRQVSRAARCAQWSIALQALTWVSLLASGRWHGTWGDRALSTLAIAALSLGWLALFEALAAWLGPRQGRRLLRMLVVITPLGYSLGFDHYAFRVGWSNLLLAAQMCVLCTALMFTTRPTRRDWRALLFVCLFLLGIATAWRGLLGAFYTDAYPTFLTPHRVNLGWAVGCNIALVLSMVALLVAWREEAERRLQNEALTDGLTGVLNRRAWTEAAARQLQEAHRFQWPAVVVMLDIDHFKRINDEHGHETGDRALKLLAQALHQNARAGDLIGRYGGEEFCLLLNRASADIAEAFDRRLRDAVSSASQETLGLPLAFSAGLVERSAGAPHDLEQLLRLADAALYRAKRDGRGCLRHHVDASSAAPPPLATA